MSREPEPHHHHDHDDDDVQEHREHGAPLIEVELRVRALESLLVDTGLVDAAALDAIIDTYETKVGPRNGAKVVAHAWVDPDYRRRRLEDGTAAVAEYGFVGRQSEKLVVVENTPKAHNMVVCTLCSCYPLPSLAGRAREARGREADRAGRRAPHPARRLGSGGASHASRPAHRVARARMSS